MNKKERKHENKENKVLKINKCFSYLKVFVFTSSLLSYN